MRRSIVVAMALGLVLVLIGALSPVQTQAAGPGLYVTNLNLSPAQPAFNQNVSFVASFSNTSSVVQTFTWRVFIFRADTPNRSNTETTYQLTGFPVGASDNPAIGTFRYGPTGFVCEYFFARVGWLDANNQITFFPAADGTVYQKGFTVCDSSVIPTPVAPSPAAPAKPAPPGPGVLVSDLSLSPAQPAFNQDILFNAAFNNTATTVQTFNWRVFIYRADTPNRSNSETTYQLTGFPVGASNIPSLGTFSYGPTGYTCEYFFARVGWLDANNQITFFPATDGSVFQKGFKICDSSTIPTPGSQAAAPSPAAAAPGPGLFVTNIRLQPFDTPLHNMDISFFPTFQNTSTVVQTFKWKVYIWRADTVTKTDNETSLLTTGFPVGTGEYQALGTYRYGPTGYQCDYFFARVGWLDDNNKVTYFPMPNGQVYEKGFKICN